MTLKEMERQHIIEVLKKTGGNKAHAASLLDIARGTLYEKLKYYQIKPSLYKQGSCNE